MKIMIIMKIIELADRLVRQLLLVALQGLLELLEFLQLVLQVFLLGFLLLEQLLGLHHQLVLNLELVDQLVDLSLVDRLGSLCHLP